MLLRCPGNAIIALSSTNASFDFKSEFVKNIAYPVTFV